MGNANKSPQSFKVVNTFNPQNWINIEKKTGFEIWENVDRKILADVYPLSL